MVRSTAVLAAAATAVAVVALSAPSSAYVPQAASTFAGRSVLSSPAGAVNAAARRGDMSMKKGKPNVPPQMRGQYKRAQEMQNMREQMISAQSPGEDGLPIFNLFVRSKVAEVWYPCGSFKGDDRSAALASNYRDQGLLAGLSKNQLDSGVSGSLYRDMNKLVDTVVRGYPQLKKSRDDLEFGYKLAYEGLGEEQKKITVVKPEEKKGVFDNIKSMFG